MRLLLLLLPFLYCSCSENSTVKGKTITSPIAQSQNQSANNIIDRFPPPKGFQRISSPPESFAYYLQHLPLKPVGAKVYLHNGQLKPNQQVHAAVLDIDVGKRDLQQCADAIMRLRAEYLFKQNLAVDIKFNFTNGFPATFSRWSQGQGIRVSGNQVNWIENSRNDGSYESFRRYLNMVFSYAGTLSLSKELPSKSLEAAAIGDIFIQGGSPGHAVVIVDMALHQQTGKKAFLLAQSYMPAQDIHILINPQSTNGNPWYFLDEIEDKLITPEWTFTAQDLKHF